MLCFVRRSRQLLMIRKKRGLGAGKINAPGGRIEQKETPLEAAIAKVRKRVSSRLRPLHQIAMQKAVI